ncbi:MAG: geranylgeranyl reductase family protein [Saprospiraceae bacterium]|nr:geranylgeranyl reductase family protein [Saprospiraceae bacterium]
MKYINSKVCIVGAGPGGVAAALKLSYDGIPSVLLDKSVFPRDKVCGDAISGKVTTLLNRLDPAILERFQATGAQIDVWGIRFVAPNGKPLDIPFHPNYIRNERAAPGYVAKRWDFDQFLIEEVKRRPDIKLLEGVAAAHYEQIPRGWRITDEARHIIIETDLLIVADGAHSSFSRKHAGLVKDDSHYAAAIRAYYTNVSGFSTDNFIELHFLKPLLPGYFWVFPLPGGNANVGLGIRSDVVKRRRINLSKTLDELLADYPTLRERFQHASRVGEAKGYGLPLGSKSRPISGRHYMLVGDAASLVDPLTGEGIGNAFYSGFIAADQAKACLETGDFSPEFLKAYDQRVARVLGSEMKLSYRLQRIMTKAPLVNIVANIITGNPRIRYVLSAMYNDFNLREQLAKPLFWWNMWRGKKIDIEQ